MLKALLCLVLVAAMSTGAVYAAGGIYIDNFAIKSNGSVVFSDAFDQGKLTGWTKMSDATFVPDGPDKPQGAMHLNKHVFCASAAYHKLSAKDTGVVEMTYDIYCTKPQEQYDWQIKKLGCVTNFTLYSGTSAETVTAIVKLNSGQSTYHLGLSTGNAQKRTAYTKQPILQPEQWAKISLRLDPNSSTATLSLNGKPVTSLSYNAQEFQSLREVGLVTGMGDGSKRTD